MQPDWICISSDEFIDVDAINSLWSPNSHLFAIHKYKHELPFPFLFRGLLSRCELLLLFRHFCNDPQSAKRGIKWTTSASLGRRVVPNLGYILFRLLRPSKAALEQIWGEARTSGRTRSFESELEVRKWWSIKQRQHARYSEPQADSSSKQSSAAWRPPAKPRYRVSTNFAHLSTSEKSAC